MLQSSPRSSPGSRKGHAGAPGSARGRPFRPDACACPPPATALVRGRAKPGSPSTAGGRRSRLRKPASAELPAVGAVSLPFFGFLRRLAPKEQHSQGSPESQIRSAGPSTRPGTASRRGTGKPQFVWCTASGSTMVHPAPRVTGNVHAVGSRATRGPHVSRRSTRPGASAQRSRRRNAWVCAPLSAITSPPQGLWTIQNYRSAGPRF